MDSTMEQAKILKKTKNLIGGQLTANFQHFIEVPKEGKINIGDRVRPVFEANRNGNLRDIKHFEIVPV